MDKLLKDFFSEVLADDLILRIIEMRENGLSDLDILSNLILEYEVNEDD